MEKRWVVRRSEPVKEVLLIEGKVYPGGTQGTIGLRIQNRFNSNKYRRTRTGSKTGTKGWANPIQNAENAFSGIPLTISKYRHLHQNTWWRVGTCPDQFGTPARTRRRFQGLAGPPEGVSPGVGGRALERSAMAGGKMGAPSGGRPRVMAQCSSQPVPSSPTYV